ncbi:PAS domain S-box protein [Microcoleus vaginatus PCC 9802]|uniref:ATP-binding protein n=1 Tax=Microcoleus vaginatus TaxID=119532 RepID=UPI00020D11C7|nr:multi-sensor signal transduction histidine kinase [Microcoleus vaginatus FGP-2]UNU18316.1 PAS domain S-box protein [Microcoleus vaginatus PCC 9802]
MATDIRHQPENGYYSEPTQPSPTENLSRRSLMRLPRTLSPLETWGFGMTGLIAAVAIGPSMHVALGPNAFLVWLPTVLMGVMLNLQVKRLGEQWPEMSGGTPNYITRLLSNFPLLGRYAAIAYFLAWAVYPSVNAIILTELIKANLEPLAIACPETLLRIGFTLIAYIVAFSGSRALAILHAFFIIPAMGFLLVFSIQGMGWLAFSPDSPGLFPSSWPTLTFIDWAKWSFFAIYGPCACETASSFVADSRLPRETLRVLSLTAWLIPPVYLGSSWILMRLATSPELGEDSFNNLLAAASPFWGPSASLIVTLLLASSSLLSSATCVSNSPRILYQLALDGHVSPVFAYISRRGVLEPALVFSLLLGLIGLVWGDVTRIVVVCSASYVIMLMALYLGMWLRRGSPEVRWPWWGAGFFVFDGVVLVVGGLGWGWQDLTIGVLFPVAILAVDAAIRRISFAPFHRAWWIRHYRARRKSQIEDFVAFQVVVLILLVCSAVGIGWVVRSTLDSNSSVGSNLLVVLILTVTFIGVAIACWTSLPQVVSMDEAREAAEQLFVIAIDAIVVLDENGMIRQANPASERLFELSTGQLIGRHLNKLLPGLANQPERWPSRSEQTLNLPAEDSRILEVAISDRFSQDASLFNQELQEYVVILRDITDRKQAQESLQKANEELEIKVENRTSELRYTVEQLQNEIEERQQIEANLRAMQNQIVVQEKLASLGSLTAGIAHEIRNPLNFVNNFSELSAELTEELFEELGNQAERLAPETKEYIAELLTDLTANLKKINQHGQRADKIVGNMLLHSRGQSGHWEATDINSLLAEYINLAYHGMRAKEAAFNITIETDYDNDIGEVDVVPQDIGRVFLNIISNACYATYKKKQEMGEVFSPLLDVRTRNLGDAIEIRIRDNGSGIKPEVLDKIFNPFFTTKPPAEGTGLGLSISQDVIVQQHQGELKVETEVGKYTEFIITLPKKVAEIKE